MKLDKPYWGVLIFCAGLLFFPLTKPMSSHIDDQKSAMVLSFPIQLGAWTGRDLEVDDRTYEVLETRNVLSRAYKDPKGRQIHLLLVGSYKDRRVAHPPEVCYLSSNFVILNEAESKLDIRGKVLPVKEFLAQSEKDPSHQERVLYLYKVGDRFTTNYYSQQLQFALDRASRRESEIWLIRLAIPKESNSPEMEIDQDFKEFLSLLLLEFQNQ